MWDHLLRLTHSGERAAETGYGLAAAEEEEEKQGQISAIAWRDFRIAIEMSNT